MHTVGMYCTPEIGATIVLFAIVIFFAITLVSTTIDAS